MTSGWHYNNFGIESIGIVFVLGHSPKLSISKVLLISPIICHDKLLLHLARKTTDISSFEEYLIEHIASFSNFNRRFYDNLINTVNAIQLLHDLEIVEIVDGKLSLRESIKFSSNMGKRAEKIFKASKNISKMLQPPSETLYLNLRIEL